MSNVAKGRRQTRHAKQTTQGRRSAATDPQLKEQEYITFNLTKVARALLARLLFVIHSLITIWQTVEIYQKQAYWSFSLITIAILIEGAVTLLQRGGDESRW